MLCFHVDKRRKEDNEGRNTAPIRTCSLVIRGGGAPEGVRGSTRITVTWPTFRGVSIAKNHPQTCPGCARKNTGNLSNNPVNLSIFIVFFRIDWLWFAVPIPR